MQLSLDAIGRTLEAIVSTNKSERPIDTIGRYAHLWHPRLRINRVMLQTHWSAEAWSQIRVEFRKAVALGTDIRRAGWCN